MKRGLSPEGTEEDAEGNARSHGGFAPVESEEDDTEGHKRH